MPEVISFFDIIRLIVGLIVILAAVYYTMVFIASRQGKGTGSRNIRIYERFALSKDKSICIIGVRDKAYLVVITNGAVSVLETYDAEEMETGEGNAQAGFASQGIVQKGIMRGFSSLKGAFGAGSRRDKKAPEETADFSSAFKRASADDIISAYAREEEKRKQKTEEEDGIDEIYRRLQNRKTSEGQKGADRKAD